MTTPAAPRTSRRVQFLLLVLAVGLSFAIVWFTNQYQQELRNLGDYGYVGLFVISLIFLTPRLRRICAPIPYSRRSALKPNVSTTLPLTVTLPSITILSASLLEAIPVLAKIF